MKETFRWNPYADQPHNVAPKKERFRHHLRHAPSYIPLFLANLKKLVPGLSRYRKYRKSQYQQNVAIQDPFALSVSPVEGKNEDIIGLLKETGTKKTLIRIASWEEDCFGEIEDFCRHLQQNGLEIVFALLQNREDVLSPERWSSFLDSTFSRFKSFSPYFEIGHGWNRTKWGVWDYKEYLGLARPALDQAEKHQIKLIGPAVLDFEFHLYPPVLKKIPFDIVSSLLYVDRVGAPENTQAGWDTAKKVALLRAVVDVCIEGKPLWITEVNWPLEGTGKYSPVAGKPMVSEEEQADYLVRYYILCLASGFVDRIYWWQLVAPGYGLIDSRDTPWRKRPGYAAFKAMVSLLRDSQFQGKIPHPQAEIFSFRKDGHNFAALWTKKRGQSPFIDWGQSPIIKMVGRDGEEVPLEKHRVEVSGSPLYVFFE
jgi:hypothetical protein